MIIYVICNVVDGKLYVGKTKNSLEHRMRHHFPHVKGERIVQNFYMKPLEKKGVGIILFGMKLIMLKLMKSLMKKKGFG